MSKIIFNADRLMYFVDNCCLKVEGDEVTYHHIKDVTEHNHDVREIFYLNTRNRIVQGVFKQDISNGDGFEISSKLNSPDTRTYNYYCSLAKTSMDNLVAAQQDSVEITGVNTEDTNTTNLDTLN